MYDRISVFDAARYILKNSKWNLSQIELQKLLYIAQMVHLGKHGRPLMRGMFTASKYGPRNESLREILKIYGLEALSYKDVGGKDRAIKNGSTEQEVLDEVVEEVSGRTPAQLMNFICWEEGAWHQTYDERYIHLVISEFDMIEEYLKREKIAQQDTDDQQENE